jgi:hypothetical protein
LKESAIDIGSRLELFVDEYLIDRLAGATLTIHRPSPQNVVLRFDRPWEGNACGYVSVFKDGDTYRMYYRSCQVDYTQGAMTVRHTVVGYAESSDGINWERPSLGLVEFEGSRDNNIIWDGVGSSTFVVFQDANPDCEPDARYKALAAAKEVPEKHAGGLHALKSADGVRWSMMTDELIITDGAFDSQNLAFWDTVRGEYREYHRDFRPGRDSRGNANGRDIKTATTKDFLKWPDPAWLSYSPGRLSQLYTNQVIPYYRAPHIFLGFPRRYVDRGWTESTRALPQPDYHRLRASSNEREGTAITDGMLMSSRDGLNFNIWPESFIRPGLRDTGGWFYGDNEQNWGLVETASHVEGAPDELSVYVTEAYEQMEITERLRRHTLRIDGFVSVNARLSGGELLTHPLVFEGGRLVLNFSSSIAGDIRVELQDANGHRLDGFGMDDCDEVYGDDLERTVSWNGGTDVSALAGQPVRLRIALRDADLYSIRFK